MNYWCDLCDEEENIVYYEWDDKCLWLCRNCDDIAVTLEDLYAQVWDRRWKASKSDKQWNADQPITDTDRGIEPGTG